VNSKGRTVEHSLNRLGGVAATQGLAVLRRSARNGALSDGG